MRTRIIGIGLVGVLAGALALAGGCGGGNPRLERARVRDRDERGLRPRQPGDRADHVSGLRPSRSSMASATARVVAIHRESLDSLRALRPPKDYETTAKLWIALVDQSIDELDAMRAALRGGRRVRGDVVCRRRQTRSTHDRGSIARKYGITPCKVPELTA